MRISDWSSDVCSSDLGPEKLRELIWINGVYSFEDAIAELASEGIVDPDRIGIAGYSRGSQMVNVAMTQSEMFRAASSGDGNYLEPASYSDRSEEHTSELQSLMRISYAVFCLTKTNT